MKSTSRNRNSSDKFFYPLIEIVLSIYNLNFIIGFDAPPGMTGFIIFSEYWADGNDVMKMLVVFFVNKV